MDDGQGAVTVTPGPKSQNSVAATEAAMRGNKGALRLEGGMEPGTRAWHLLVSLIGYCDFNGLDARALFAEAAQHCRDHDEE